MKNPKDILIWIVIWLVVIRFWIEVVTTTILKNSQIINGINNNKIGFHHWQLGLLIILFAFLAVRIVPKWKNQFIIPLSFGLALFIDQYAYILRLVGLSLPFEYRSRTDYLVIILVVIGLFIFWKYLGEATNP